MRTRAHEGFISNRHRDSSSSCVRKEGGVLTHLLKYLLYSYYLGGTDLGPWE